MKPSCWTISTSGLLFLLYIQYSSVKGASFVFLNHSTIEGPENSTVHILFQISEHSRLNTSSIFLYINVRQSYSGNNKTLCVLVQNGTKCDLTDDQIKTSPCQCLAEPYTYQFSIVLKKEFNTHGQGILLQSFPGTVKEATISINVTYPPQVLNFNITDAGASNDSIILKGKNAIATCEYESGNPPAVVHIRKVNEANLLANFSVNEHILQHTLGPVDCQDSGLYECYATNVKEVKRATLLVQCPPKFAAQNRMIFHAYKGDSTFQMQFDVRIHSIHYTNCTLNKLDNGIERANIRCKLEGNPPDVRLTLFMMKVMNDDDNGTWRFVLTNEEGNDSLIFTFIFIDKLYVINNINIIAPVAVIVVVIIIVSLILIIRQKRKNSVRGYNKEALFKEPRIFQDNNLEVSETVDNELYESSPDGDLTVTNELYEGSGTTVQDSHATVLEDYTPAIVATLNSSGISNDATQAGTVDDSYQNSEEIMNSQHDNKTGWTDNTYADVDEIKRKKREKKHKTKPDTEYQNVHSQDGTTGGQTKSKKQKSKSGEAKTPQMLTPDQGHAL